MQVGGRAFGRAATRWLTLHVVTGYLSAPQLALNLRCALRRAS
eukprot:CAMPEP_0182564248 /NCGR_PEP_ID=MMETSP1324-20130603/6230_1 /TAXON_ID=236786 /ORGANISM="Florenciella sp., Strain RCC1587" /LENGTH=42 /DNA_ID= /DNA_START= /DNA_END= /DNA_ORIENTATION=